MATDTVYSAVRTFLEANAGGVTLHWENGGETVPAPPSLYVLVEFTGDTFDQQSLGAGLPSENAWQEAGKLFLKIYAPAGTGSLAARQQARTFADLFRGLELSPDIQFGPMSIGLGEVGEQTVDWWMLPMSISWSRDF